MTPETSYSEHPRGSAAWWEDVDAIVRGDRRKVEELDLYQSYELLREVVMDLSSDLRWCQQQATERKPFADPLASVDTPQHYERWKQMRDERDEARQIARELLEDADADDWDEHRMQKRYPWLKEKNP